jgi:hypothetical protein
MSTTAAPPPAPTAVQPIVGLFDDIGRAEHAVHNLLAAGFDRGDVSMEWEEIDVINTAPPAPRSYSAPFAFITSLLGGAILAVLAALFAPQKVTLYGLGLSISPVLALALTGGTFGWILGAILGFGRLGWEDEPAPISLQAPIITVSAQAPSRPGEARAILHAAGARTIQGGDRTEATTPVGRPAPYSAAVPVARPGPAAGAPRHARPGASPSAQGRAVSPTPPGRHERLPLSPRETHETQARPRRTGLALIAAVVVGGVLALLRRRRD